MSPSSRTILASGYSKGLYFLSFDETAGQAGQSNKVDKAEDKNLTFTVLDRETGNVYGVHEVKEFGSLKETGAVSRWKYNQAEGSLERKEVLASEGTEPAHVALDSERKLLYVTNYGGGSLAVFKLNREDGAIVSPPIFQEKFTRGSNAVPSRQEAAHLHGTFLYKQFVYVVDLGSDKIYHYKVTGPQEVGKADPAVTELKPGSGPRHLAIDEPRKRAYLINELEMTVSTFAIDDDSGRLSLLNTVPFVVPFSTEGTDQYGAAIEVHPNGKFLYVSNRGDGAVVGFKILDSSDKSLEQIEAVPTGGTWPRHFAITGDGKHLLVADQLKSQLAVFKIDPENGSLTKGSEIECGENPSMLLLL